MKIVKILEIGRDLLKLMSEHDLKRDDYQFIGMYYEYEYRRGQHEKYAVVIAELSEKYCVSETSVKRILRRLGAEV